MTVVVLTETEREFLLEARRIILCTTATDGSPRPVPACFALVEDMVAGTRLYTPLDEKPKNTGDPHLLARVRDIGARPAVSLLVDRWSEDWARLAWLRLTGSAILLEPDGGVGSIGEHAIAVAALRARYPQYARHDLSARPVIRVTLTRARSWGRLAEGIE